MASTIPRTTRKRATDAIAAKSLYVALFTNSLSTWNPLSDAQDTYTEVAALFTEVANGNGYTTGGFALTESSSYIGATNAASVFLATTTIPACTFTFRYAVIYDHVAAPNDFIEAVIEMPGGDKVATGGTITIEWDAVNGVIKCS